jgi:hypothetical protein
MSGLYVEYSYGIWAIVSTLLALIPISFVFASRAGLGSGKIVTELCSIFCSAITTYLLVEVALTAYISFFWVWRHGITEQKHLVLDGTLLCSFFFARSGLKKTGAALVVGAMVILYVLLKLNPAPESLAFLGFRQAFLGGISAALLIAAFWSKIATR